MIWWPWRRGEWEDQKLDAELRDHLERLTADYVARGMSKAQARRQARLEFGGLEQVKEATRDVRKRRMLDEIQRDLGLAVRLLTRNRGFASIAVLTLAIGVGANTAVFSVLNTIALRPLPVRAPGELVEFLTRRDGPRSSGFSWDAYERYRDTNHVFADLIGTSAASVRVSASAEPARAEYVSGNFFSALGLQPALGRFLGAGDDRPGSDAAVVVLSWSSWRRWFGGDPSVLGRSLNVGDVPAIVIGVAPREFTGLQVGVATDVWMPSRRDRARAGTQWANRFAVQMMGRLRPGVPLEQAQAEMRVLDRSRVDELARISGDIHWSDTVLELERSASGFSRLRDVFVTPLLVLMILVVLLLAIACTNVANMLLARSAARRQEMAVRVSLGASRGRLVRQVLTESLVLAAVGSGLAVVIAYWATGAVTRIMASGTMMALRTPLQIPVTVDGRVLLFTATVAILAALMCGSVPAWTAFSSAPASFLRNTVLGAESRSRRVFGRGLVVVQVALSIMLLGVAGMFAGHLSNLRNVDLGFERTSILLVTADTSRSGYQLEERAQLFEQLLGQLKALPGVQSVTLSNVTPIQGAGAASFIRVPGVDEAPAARRMVPLNWVAPGWFDTFGTPVLTGRDFRFEDASAPPVAIVNEAMARHYFGGNAIGKRFALTVRDRSYEIVGVVGDAKYADLHEPAPHTIYFNAFQENRGVFSQFALRTTAAPMTLVPEVRQMVSRVLPNVSLSKVTTLSEQMDASLVPERLTAVLSRGLGALGGILALIGLYGLLSYTVARRTNEIGVRMAFGATTSNVTGAILRDAMAVVAAGLVVGVPVGIWIGRLTADAMGIVTASAAWPVVFASVTFVGVAAVAAYVPARRAARIDPIVALRCE